MIETCNKKVCLNLDSFFLEANIFYFMLLLRIVPE